MYLSKNFKHSRAKNTFKIAWSDAINFHLPCKKMALLSICIMTGKSVILPILKVIFQPMETSHNRLTHDFASYYDSSR